MTSVDSGVETSNDSNDSSAYATAQTGTSSLTVDDSPIKISLKLKPLEKMSEEAASSSSSEAEGPKPSQSKEIPRTLPDISWPLELESPAGLCFCNLKPSSSFNFGTGYQVGGGGGGKGYVVSLYSAPKTTGKFRKEKRFSRNYSSYLEFKTPLDERKLRNAVATNNVENAQALLSAGVNPNCIDEQLRSPLHLAASRGYSEIVRLLLERGANPNQRDSLGNTPLHLAACLNNIKVVTLLLQGGTDIFSSDNYGRNPLQLAQSKLRLVQTLQNPDDAALLKAEVQEVIKMMHLFLSRKGCNCEAELIGAFANRLTLSNTKEQVETDVRDLLASLDNLSIDKH